MPEGKNKGYGYMDGMIVRLEKIIEGLEAAEKASGPELRKAVDKWIVAVEKDAKINLNRPRWLLQENITNKVVDYAKNHKIWAMTGFRFQTKNPRDPGQYGQYHEAGWAPDRKTVKVPDHFLKKAKQKHRDDLQADIDAALGRVAKVFEDTVKSGGN